MASKSPINMIRSFIIILSALLLFACNGNPSSNTLSNKQTDSIEQNTDSLAATSPSILLPWEIDFDLKTKKATIDFNNSYLNTDSIITALNYTFPDINLQKIKISNDTLFTAIKNSYNLTDGMGTSGAAIYIATAVINLTAVKGVNAVKINFQQGSHASPGVWNKDEFNDFTITH